jgi:hypothetical protein
MFLRLTSRVFCFRTSASFLLQPWRAMANLPITYLGCIDLSLLKALDRPQDKRLPLDVRGTLFIYRPRRMTDIIYVQIIIESVVAFTLFIVGVIIHAPPLKEITWASEMSRK